MPDGRSRIRRGPAGCCSSRLVVEKIPLFVLAAASCAVTLAAHRNAVQPLEQLPFPWRLANAAVAYVAYLGKMLYPAGLAVLYPLPKGPPPAWEMVAAVAVLLAISTAVFVARRKCPYLLFGWLWYLGTLVPVIGLVQVGSQAMADRFTYLTQIGLSMAIAWGAVQRGRLVALSSLGVCGRLGAGGGGVDGVRLAADAVLARQRDVVEPHVGLYPAESDRPLQPRDALAARGQFDEAIDHYRKALEVKPDYAEAHYNLGIALAGRGQVDEAIGQYRKALEINARLRAGPQQPRIRVGRPRTVRRGDRPLPEGPGNQSGLPGGPQQPRVARWPAADRSTRRSTSTGRP